MHIDTVVIDNALHHAADRVFGPQATWHELGVARKDRRASKTVFFLHQHTALPHGSQTVGCSKACRSTANDQRRTAHADSTSRL